ncbi:MAG TPA: malate synthase A [Terriglobales bacterium]|nr:malate synthase A [Terriglobales bacterium]
MNAITNPASATVNVERQVLTPAAVQFLQELHRRFEPTRRQSLAARRKRQEEFDRGEQPKFLDDTREIREGAWRVAPIPADLQDRRVEITGPPERKMLINALNSGASVYMSDFEDANSPTWMNCLEGQQNLRDAVAGNIQFTSPEGKLYRIKENPAVLFVRPRGWHLNEKHFTVDGAQISASLFDFGLFFFHNATALVAKGTGPYFYLPKMEAHSEARLWNDVFLFAQEYVGLPKGTIRATVLIETITAAFEMNEILYELRDHSAGLNCGRWDYIFSFIKKFRNHADHVLPDRGLITMEQHFLKSYVELLIHTCHRRGIHAMGGMAAQIPIRGNPEANEAAMERVRQDKLREVRAGHDGTWVAHPGLVSVAKAVFDEYMKTPNQIKPPAEAHSRVTAEDLLRVPRGPITENGLRRNIDVALQYLQSWVGGQGCVPIYELMEDAATSEICRAQIWQWLHHAAKFEDGRTITQPLFEQMLKEVVADVQQRTGANPKDLQLAADLLQQMSEGNFEEFLTTVAYQYLP